MSTMDQVYAPTQPRLIISWLLPLCLVALMGSGITFLHSIFNTNTRWFLFALLVAHLLFKNYLIRCFDKRLFFCLICYISWCFFTTFWSNVPVLSFVKSSMLLIIVISMMCGGIEWVRNRPWEEAIDYLWMLSAVTLLAGFLGHSSSASTVKGQGGVILYQGLTNGSNMFGTLLSMSFPYLLWKAYTAWSNNTRRLIYLLLVFSCVYFLVLSASRSAMLIMVLTLLGFLFSLKMNKKLSLFLIIILVAFSTLVIKPSLIENVSQSVKKFVYKTEQSNLFYSRVQYWAFSQEAAKEGGWVGLGYGAAWRQEEFDFKGLTSNSYGREKANSQLATLEETGIVGFTLYLILVSTLSFRVLYLFFKTKDNQQKILVGILSGLFFGLLAQSVFEAWWDSPASPEGSYFWLLIGIFRGLELSFNKRMPYVSSAMEA